MLDNNKRDAAALNENLINVFQDDRTARER